MTSIAFAGLTAAGKTTHAQRLAADLGYDYVSATDILFEILRVPRDAHPWFNQADAISAAREDGAVDAELESRLVDLARTSDRAVFDSWALAWICPVPVIRIWIESDLPSRTRKCLVSLCDEPRPLAECEGVLRAKDDYNRAMFRRRADPRARRLPGHVPGEQHPAGRLGLDPLQPRGDGDAPGATRHHQHRRPDPVQRRPDRQPGSLRPVPRPTGRGPAGRQPIRLPAVTPRMTLHVIYGIACAGKSTTALRLAADNGVRTIVSTDYLREVQRLYVPAAQSPVLAKVSHTAWELSGDPTPGGIIAGFTSHAEAVFPAVEAVAAKLTRDGLDAVIEGSPFHGALITRLRQHCQDAAVHPVLVTVDSLPQLLDHITDKEQQRAPGAEPRGWRANAGVLMTIQDFLISDAARHAIPRMRAAQPILDGGSL
jgi:2-phosphoglycerate kinase